MVWFSFFCFSLGTKPIGFGGDHGGCGCGCGDGSVGFDLGLAMAMVMDVVVAMDLVVVGCASRENGS